MFIKIPKITLDLFEIAGDEGQEAELHRQESEQRNAWNMIFSGIVSGEYKAVQWDSSKHVTKNHISFMRYILHRSTKRPGFLQLSVMEIRNGKIIPTSDLQIEEFRNFLRWVTNPADGTVTVI